ncbi:hypothetical protein BG004_005573 [Podila humilis]|nr:hypothetical protein BG004_005573 [Podila humilis]
MNIDRPCETTMTGTAPSSLPSPSLAPIPSDSLFSSLPSFSSGSPLANAIATNEPSTASAFTDNPDVEHGPPTAVIAGAGAGAVVVILAAIAWFIIRRRKQQTQQLQQQSKSNAVSPSNSPISSKSHAHKNSHSHPDLEKQQLDTCASSNTHHTPGHDTKPGRQQQQHSAPHVIYPPVPTHNHTNHNTKNPAESAAAVAARAAIKRASQQSTKQQHRQTPSIHSQTSNRTSTNSGIVVIDVEGAMSSVPPRRDSMHYQPDIAIEVQGQLETSNSNEASVQNPVIPPSNPATATAIQSSQDVHIDMVSLNLEDLMPLTISEDICILDDEEPAPLSSSSPGTPTPMTAAAAAAAQIIPATSSASAETAAQSLPQITPVHVDHEIIPSPVPRRPSMATRKSTDSVRSRIISTCHPPPPPPPSIPLPALPAVNSRGRRSTSSSHPSSMISSRRSISLESANRWSQLSSANGSARSSQEVQSSVRVSSSMTTTSPPSAASHHQHTRMRSQHLRSPSQILGTQSFFSPDSSPIAISPPPSQQQQQQQHMSSRRPISPPSAPLTVQIPRQNSRSIHMSPLKPTNFAVPAQPESPTIGSNEISPVTSPTNSIAASLADSSSAGGWASFQSKYQGGVSSSPAHYLTPSQRSRIRTSSDSQSMIPMPGAMTVTNTPAIDEVDEGGNLALAMPITNLGDQLPPPPPSHSFLLRRFPSLLQHRPSTGSLSSMNSFQGGSGSGGRDSAMSDEQEDDHDESSQYRGPRTGSRNKQRRSMSLDSSMRWTREGTNSILHDCGGGAESSDPLAAAAKQDQQVQAIIADALAIAQAKSAAVEAARQSTWYRQYQSQQLLLQQQQMQIQMLQQQQDEILRQQQQQPHHHQEQKNLMPTTAAATGTCRDTNTSPWALSESHFTEEKTTVSACTSRSSSPFYSTLDEYDQ